MIRTTKDGTDQGLLVDKSGKINSLVIGVGGFETPYRLRKQVVEPSTIG